MIDPKIGLDHAASFTVAYSIGAIAVAVALTLLMSRMRISLRRQKWTEAPLLAILWGLFMWLIGFGWVPVLLVGALAFVVVLVIFGGVDLALREAGRMRERGQR